MATGKYVDPDPLTTAGTSLGADGLPLDPALDRDTASSRDVRRAPTDRVLGDDDYWSSTGPGPKIMAADTLEGDDVVDPSGEKLGDLDHIMIDVPTGRVAYAVLSVGGFLGMGDKLFAIPWKALQIDPENERFVLNVDKEKLQNAPGFDKDSWPSMADEQWATDVHSYYGTRPYWE